MDLDIRLFENELVGLLNRTGLPIEVKRLVLLEVLNKVNTEADKVVNDQIAQARAKEEAENGIQ